MSSGAGLAKARRKLGTVSRSLRLTRKGTLASSSGLKEAVAEIRGATTRMRDLTKPLSIGAVDIKKLIDDSFHLQRDPGGTPWEELSESTTYNRYLDLIYGRQRNRNVDVPDKIVSQRGSRFLSRKRTRGEQRSYKARITARKARKVEGENLKKAMAYDPKILVDTGRLRNSWFARAGKTSIIFGTNTSYAIYHQSGGDKIPKRWMAPVQNFHGTWLLVDRGPAGVVFERIRRSIMDYVAPEVT